MTQEYTLTTGDGEQTVSVTVDFEKLALVLGARALKRTSGKATAVRNAVVVKKVKSPKPTKT